MRRLAIAFAVAASGLAAIPAGSLASTTASQLPGMSGSGTLNGFWSSSETSASGPVVVQFATVQQCREDLYPSSFVVKWTDPNGSHTFRETAIRGGSVCADWPFDIGVDSPGTTVAPFDSSISAVLFSPDDFPPAGEIGFNLTVPDGTIFVAPQVPGPLQGAPGRIQAFGTSSAT
jgi:hypothetical protein